MDIVGPALSTYRHRLRPVGLLGGHFDENFFLDDVDVPILLGFMVHDLLVKLNICNFGGGTPAVP